MIGVINAVTEVHGRAGEEQSRMERHMKMWKYLPPSCLGHTDKMHRREDL